MRIMIVGSYFNVSITFANISIMFLKVSVTIPIVHVLIVGLYYH